MEGNELDKAAEEYAIDSAARTVAKFSFKAGANWKTERENAELTRTSKELDAMTTKYNELSRKYDDLYRKMKA